MSQKRNSTYQREGISDYKHSTHKNIIILDQNLRFIKNRKCKTVLCIIHFQTIN